MFKKASFNWRKVESVFSLGKDLCVVEKASVRGGGSLGYMRKVNLVRVQANFRTCFEKPHPVRKVRA